jgi:hypothetical protein
MVLKRLVYLAALARERHELCRPQRALAAA